MSIVIEKLFLQILNMSITGGYCILAVFALRWLFRKAPKRYTYLLWIVVALRLVCPFTFDSAFSIFNLNLVPEAVTVELPETAEGQGVTVQIGNMGDQYLNNGSEGQGQQSQAMPDASGQTGMNAGHSGAENQYNAENKSNAENQISGENLSGEDGSGQTGSGTTDIRWTQAGSWIWIGGMIALAVLMSISWIRLRLHIRTAIRIRDNIYETEGIDSPFVMGSIRTKIYLPAGLTKEQQELILLHENCHVHRKDHLFKILASLLTIVYWFNPLVWAAWFGFCRDMEMSCDEMALKDADGEMRKAYSQTLLAVAVHKPFSWQMPPAFGENNIKSRIKHVLNLKKPAVWVGGAFVVILVAVLVIFGTDGRKNVPDETLSESVSGESDQNSGEEESSDSGETEVSTDPAVKESDAGTESSGQLSAEEKGTEIWSDVVMMEMPGAVEGLEDRVAIVLKSTAELEELGAAAGVTDTIAWQLMAGNFAARFDAIVQVMEYAVLAIPVSDPTSGYEYDATVYENDGKLFVELLRYMRKDAAVSDAVVSQLILINISGDLGEELVISEVNVGTTDIVYTAEDMAAWNRPFGMANKLMNIQNADLDHDGADEQIVFYYIATEDGYGQNQNAVKIGVFKNGECIGTEYFCIDGPFSLTQNSNMAYFLYQKDDKEYLLLYQEILYDRQEYSSYLKIMDINQDGYQVWQSLDSVWIRWDKYRTEHFPVSADEMENYADFVEEVLDDSICIYSATDEEVYWAPSYVSQNNGTQNWETFSLLFADDEAYGSCETIAESVDIFNQTLKEKWFTDGEIPEMPEEYKALMAELMLEVRPNMTAFENLLNTDRSVLFEDYNGEQLQFVEDPDYEVGNPQYYSGKIYYRPESEQSPEEVVQYMAEALMEHLMNDFPEQEFVITKYRLEEQSLTSWEDIVNSYTNDCWIEYLNEYRGVQDNLLEYAKSWVEGRFSSSNAWVMALQEDMWYFILDGYYRYEGGTSAFEQRASWGDMVDDMVPFQEGDGMYPGFVLVKYGDVYGLQKGWRWGE